MPHVNALSESQQAVVHLYFVIGGWKYWLQTWSLMRSALHAFLFMSYRLGSRFHEREKITSSISRIPYWTSGETFKDKFSAEYLPTTASEIRIVFSLRIFFCFLDKSVLLHRRCLMSKFFDLLMLVYRKIFCAFNPVMHETFSKSYGFPLK